MALMIIAVLAAFSGFAALCATTRRQIRQIWKTPPSAGKLRLVRTLGWAMLALALAPCVAWWASGGGPRWTPAMGIVAWTCLLPVAALALTLLFTFAGRRVILVATVAGGLAWTLTLAWGLGAFA